MPNFLLIDFMTTFAGIGNYTNQTVSKTIPAQSLSAFNFVDITTSISMNRGDSISQIQTKYTGLETIWRILSGRHIIYKPSFAAASYTVQAYASFSNSILTITIRVANATASPIVTPTFTLDARVFLYKSPFED